MKKIFLAAGVAALAISIPAAAERGGKANEKRAQAAKVERGGGERARNARADRARSARAERGREARADNARSARAERSREARAERAQAARSERLQDRRAQQARSARAERLADRRADRAREARAERTRERRMANREEGIERRRDRAENIRELRAERMEQVRERRQQQRRLAQQRNRDDVRFRDFDRDRFDRRFAERGLPAGFVNGCPPGLAKQNELCMPPGQYKKMVGQRLPARYRAQALPTGLRNYYRDTDDYYHRYGNGYVYRVGREQQLIRSVLPLIGAGLGIGMPFPYSSSNYHVPTAYQPFYRNSADDYYRYANGYVYEIDRDTGLIGDMIPLLDQGYGVGQMLPASYSYYNLPYQYRSHYRDNDDYLYRYAPGAIYQVDRESRLITAIVSLLTGTNNGLSVGQPLPMGYDAYNVPYDYRDRYYDTSDNWYRYSNGSIYQVDPTTRLITAVIDAIV